MSNNQNNEDQSKETLAFFKSIPNIISSAFEDQKKREAERKAITDKFFAKQFQEGHAELDTLKEHILQALPGEQKRLKRKISIQEGDVKAIKGFIISEQEKLEDKLYSHFMHRKYANLSVHTVRPEEMWEHYKMLTPGEIGGVYTYQLNRELHHFLEYELIELEIQVDTLISKRSDELDDLSSSSRTVSNTSLNVQTAEAASMLQNGEDDLTARDKVSYVQDRSFRELFEKSEDVETILALFLNRGIIDENHQWKGQTIYKSELAAMARVLEAKDYLKNCSSGELARACNAYFGVTLDESIYRKEASKGNNRYYWSLIPSRSKMHK